MAASNEYELQRARRIEENQRRMEQLGVADASHRLQAAAPRVALEAGAVRAPRLKKRRAEPVRGLP